MAKGDIQRAYDRRVLTFNNKAQALGIRGRVTAEELARLPLACHYCAVELTHEQSDFDHVIPFARGGTNTIDNIVRACASCNGVKFTKTPEEFSDYTGTVWVCPICDRTFRPRYSDWRRGYGRVCSRSCAGKLRWNSGVHADPAGAGGDSHQLRGADAGRHALSVDG